MEPISGWDQGVPATGAGEGASGNHNGSSSTLSGPVIFLGCYPAGLFWSGDIAEVLMFPVNLSDSDRGVIESYLANKYGL